MNNSLSFKISGISCQACIKLLTMKFTDIKGVKDIHIQIDGKTAITSDRPLGISEIKQVLSDTHYQVG